MNPIRESSIVHLIVLVLLCIPLITALPPINKPISLNINKRNEVVDSKTIAKQNDNSNSDNLGSMINNLLVSLLQQTLYTRMENLLLDPGRKSLEKQKLVDSAVKNYHHQKHNEAHLPGDNGFPVDFQKLAGYWIRETPAPPLLMASKVPEGMLSATTNTKDIITNDRSEQVMNTEADYKTDYKTEVYQITDLFTSSTSTDDSVTSSTTEIAEIAEIEHTPTMSSAIALDVTTSSAKSSIGKFEESTKS